MLRTAPRRRRIAVVVLVLGLTAGLAACDSGGSGKAASTTSTTRRRKPHASTTTSSSTSTTTLGGAQPDTAVTDPNAPSTTTSPAGASPCGAVQTRLSAVVTGGDLGSVPVDQYTVTNCRLASSNLIWGAVTLAPKSGTSVPRLTVVFERIGSIWNVHSYDHGPTGCDAPAPVPTQLGLGC